MTHVATSENRPMQYEEMGEFSIEGLQGNSRSFLADRPSMEMNNRDVYRARKLLVDECRELNGRDEEGFFSLIGKREDYRQQEVSDLVMFAFPIADAFGQSFASVRTESMTDRLLAAYSIPKIAADIPMKAPREWSENGWRAHVFQELKLELNRLCDQLEAFDLQAQKDEAFLVLEYIVAICFAMHHTLHVNPYRAVREKIARNAVKFPAFMFAVPKMLTIPDEESSPEEKARFAAIMQDHYERARNHCIAVWKGDLDKHGRRDRTREFYHGDRDEYRRNQRVLRQRFIAAQKKKYVEQHQHVRSTFPIQQPTRVEQLAVVR